MPATKLKKDHMSTEFPSIWIEISERGQQEIVIGGFYGEWTREGVRTEESQIKNIEALDKVGNTEQTK